MWQRHWNLARDPFDPRQSGYVATPTHGEAVARLVRTIETAARSAALVAPAGLGKSTVLARAIEATRGPGRRFVRSTAPDDGAGLLATLAVGLGGRLAAEAGRPSAWKALRDAVRLCRFQKIHVVLAVDSCETLESEADRSVLDRLEYVDPDPAVPLTILRVGRSTAGFETVPPPADWGLSIRLDPLTRGEAADYLTAKLRAAGRDEPTFTPRALTRLHALAGGVPRGLDRLAGLCLMASAVRGLEVIPAEIVEGAALDCLGASSASAEG